MAQEVEVEVEGKCISCYTSKVLRYMLCMRIKLTSLHVHGCNSEVSVMCTRVAFKLL